MHEAVLQAESLAIGYPLRRGEVRTVADGLDLRLGTGELVCLLGPNGAGKSTLLRTLSGLQPALGGRVLLDGQELHRLSPVERARRVSVVLTDRVTAGMLTAYDVVGLGRQPHTDWTGRLTEHDHAVIRRSLDAVGAATLAARHVAELSDGERQRIMVARALAQEPRVMILDEITAFLDLPRRVEIMRLLSDLAHHSGTAILVSTHDLDLALRTADRLWLVGTAGRIDCGAPEDLVLAGAFEQTFASEGVTFDAREGSFKTRSTTRGMVAVAGDGLAFHWTARALERAGYGIAREASDDIPHVEVMRADDRLMWVLARQTGSATHVTLESLVDELRNS